ncbi:MAG: helix-turn-helix domain-containing protein [Gemmataceae bacterium]
MPSISTLQQAKVANHPEGAPWSLQDAATFLGLCRETLSRLVLQNQIKAIRIGKRVFVPDTEVKRLSQVGL